MINIKKFVKNILLEDVGRGDLYTKVVYGKFAKANIISKDNGILSGVLYVKYVAKICNIKIKFLKKDGDKISNGDLIAKLKGKSTALLSAERTILNLLQHSSGIASNTNKFIQIIKNYKTKLLDTRKTRPLLRDFEKYSTSVGGAINHRLGLDDCLMLKDTHLKTIKNLNRFIKQARKKIPFTSKIEVEIESIKQAKNVMQSDIDIIMCDNMSINNIKRVIKYRDKNYPHILLEASGNISLETIENIAQTGIDAISSGSLIHQATWLDFSMKFK